MSSSSSSVLDLFPKCQLDPVSVPTSVKKFLIGSLSDLFTRNNYYPDVVAVKCIWGSDTIALVNIFNIQVNPQSFALVREFSPLAKSADKAPRRRVISGRKSSSAKVRLSSAKSFLEDLDSNAYLLPPKVQVYNGRDLLIDDGVRIIGPFSQVRIAPPAYAKAELRRRGVKGISTAPQIIRYIKEAGGPCFRQRYVSPLFDKKDGRPLVYQVYFMKTPTGYIYVGGLSIASQNINVSLRNSDVSIGLLR